MQEFQGKVAVITGAASGIGLEMARLAASLGMRLALADIQQGALATVVDEFEGQGVRAFGLRTDVSRSADIQALADATLARFGQVDLLINNAGVGAGGLLWENSEQDWDWVLGVNLRSVIHGVRIFTPLMLEHAARDPAYRGHIVNTASMSGLINAPAMGVYNVSKSAVVALSETLYHDLSLVTEQVHCSVLCPYFVPTAFSDSARNRPEALASQTPLTRSQLVAQANSVKAVSSARISAAQIAELTFAALREERFYVYSHPQALAPVRERYEAILEQRNPGDPFAGKPDVRARLIADLRG
ncbi:SDR family oxidoreductase [Pseudomonas knackmussii]|uniref:SDR family oxidoreductase n=1 Tax=Pseudomonas knackmussii TaxID=65741 RepID=UPI003F4A0CCB